MSGSYFKPKAFFLVAVVALLIATGIASGLRESYAVSPAKTGQGNAVRVQKASRVPSYNSTLLDWPEFRGDALRDGNQKLNTYFNKTNTKSLLPVSGSAYTSTGSAEDSPAVYQGILYYVANTVKSKTRRDIVTSTLYAVDTTAGSVLWSFQFPLCGSATFTQFVASSRAVTTGLVDGVSTTEVFVGWGTKKGCLYDFDGLTGAIIWTYGPIPGILSSPAIMTTSTDTLVVFGDEADNINAFSVTYTGTMGGTQLPAWKYGDQNDPPPTGYSQYCLPAPTLCGDSVWSSPAEALVLVNGVAHHYAYFAIGAQTNFVGRVDAIDMDLLTNGVPTLAWSFWDPHPQYDDDFGSVTVLADASGYGVRVFSGNNTGHMFGLDAVTGAIYFDFDTSLQLGGTVQSMIHSTPALVTINKVTELIFDSGCDARYTCKGPFGYVWAIDARSNAPAGFRIWKSQNFGNDMVSSPVVANQGIHAVVFVLGTWKSGTLGQGDLLVIDPMAGNLLSDYQVLNHLYGAISTPALYGGHIFITEGYAEFNNANPGIGGLAAFQCAGCP